MSKITPNLSIVYQDVSSLVPYKRNARTHTKKQIRQLASSVQTFGFTNPILINEANAIIAGHGRVEAAKLLGMDKVPTIRLDHLSEDQIRAYIIADNRLAELAGWDNAILAIELQHLLTIDQDFDITVTGFNMPAIDLIIQDAAVKDPADEFEVHETLPVVTKFGDLWKLGDHFLHCNSALEEASFGTLMAGDKAQLIFTDPPYNVPIPGHVSGLGKARHENFAMASGEMTEAQFIGFLKASLALMARYSVDGSIHFICMDWRHIAELLTAGLQVYDELKNICVWNKTNAGMGSLYRSKHEFIGVFKNGKAAHINNVELGKNGRYRTNVWDYAGQTSLHAERDDELTMHPTVKPIAMVADAILDCSRRKGIILDPFGGSGTTLIAAEKTGRRARLIELEPRYCDVTIRRWQKLTGKASVHGKTGVTFDAAALGAVETRNA